MTKTRKLALAVGVAFGLAGAAALPVIGHTHGRAGQGDAWRGPEHVEGRIAFLKAELEITDARAAGWEAVAQAMRDNARVLGTLREELRASGDKPLSAVARLEQRQRLAAAYAAASAAFTAAFKPLYDGFNDDQRKAADALFRPHFRRG